MKDVKATEKCWWIAHGPDIHYGELSAGNHISTGQENLHIYSTEAEWIAALSVHGVDPSELNDDIDPPVNG